MTLFHFGNCLALAFVPYYLIYKYSGLSEYGSFFFNAIKTGQIFLLTQLFKMLILATFFPTSEAGIHGQSEAAGFQEFLISTVDLADLVGMFLVLSMFPGKGHAKLLTAGVGWAVADALLTRGLSLWVGAKGAEFDWKYIQKSLDSNISLVQSIITATLVWLWMRHDLLKPVKPTVTIMILLSCYKSFIMDMLISGTMGPWAKLLIKAGYTLVVGVITLKIYGTLCVEFSRKQ